MLTMKMLKRRRKVIVGFAYVFILIVVAFIAEMWLWQYREVASDAIWMFLGIFSILSLWLGMFFYLVFGRTAPDVQV